MASTNQQQRIILITGANKGIGFEVVKKLIEKPSSNSKDIILLGSRDIKRGEDALKQLGSPPNVHLLQLDTSSKQSIATATNEIKQKYGSHLDVIINNAGIVPRDNTIQAARETQATNYYGVKMLNEHLIPLLREQGRVVNVASSIGPMALHCFSKDLQEKYTSETLTKEQLDLLVEEFLAAYESNNVEKIGYRPDLPYLAYGVSKVALIALTRIEARQYSGAQNIFIYSVCPGYCATDLNNKADGARPAALGADSILYVVDTPNHELGNGGFYLDGKKEPQICMDEAKVQFFIQTSRKHLESK